MADDYAAQIKGSLHISLIKDMTLTEAIDAFTKGTKLAISKYFEIVEINAWEDISVKKLENLRNVILDSVAPSTARTYFFTICTLLYKFRKIKSIPSNFRSILYIRNDKPTPIFLTTEELRALAEVSVKSANEKYVKSTFFISSITGLKLSQIKGIKMDELKSIIESNDYSITEEINSMISCIVNFNGDLSLAGYGKALRRLARNAGILDTVSVHRKGKDIVCPKYKCLSSSVALNTYNTTVSKVEFSNQGSLFDLRVESRINLPLYAWETVDISTTIFESITKNNISLMHVASKMAIKESELLSYINGEVPINLKLLGKLLWVLNIKLQ